MNLNDKLIDLNFLNCDTSLIYDDTLNTTNITNVLLIDSNVQDYNSFVINCNFDTFPIIYSYTSNRDDLFKLLEDKFTSFKRLAIVTHDIGITNGKKFLNNQLLFTDNDLVSDGVEYSDNLNFIINVIKKFGVTNYDYLACNTLKYSNWKNYYNILSSTTGVIVGASNDATGNIKYGGDWIMESTSQDIELIYFTSGIQNYASVLVVYSLQTTFVGGSGSSGNMFNIKSNKPIYLNDFSINSFSSGTFNFLVYIRVGSFTNGVNTSSGWNKIYDGFITVTLGENKLNLNLTQLITTEQLFGLYLTFEDSNVIYTIGTASQILYVSNSDLEIYEGIGKQYSADFSGADYSPRIWNGIIWYQIPPIVTSASPVAGPLAGTQSVTIYGNYFDGATSVTFGGTVATITSVSSSSISCTRPSGSAGTVSVLVTTPIGTNAANTLYTYQAVPLVNSVSPISGPTGGGQSVTITGSYFTNVSSVTFAGVSATGVNVVSSSSITCVTPSGAAGTASVLVTTLGGTNTANTSYTYQAPPTITLLTPTNGRSTGGTSVTIAGTNFIGATSVTFGGVAAAFTVTTSSSITCTTPSGAVGAATVLVTTPSGTATSTYTYNPVPTITSISPVSGPIAGNQPVTIAGTNFNNAPDQTPVTFGGTSATNIKVVSSTSITCTTPSSAAGQTSVVVGTSVGGTASTTFTYQGAPTVTLVSPTSGPTTGGRSVTITGTNFIGASGVKFNNGNATVISVVSSTSITCTTPAGVAGTASVLVTTPSGSNFDNNLFTYQSTVPNPPTNVTATAGNNQAFITWIAPTNDGGSTITSYTVTSSGGVSFLTSGTATTATANGLTNGTTYTFTVKATNSTGTSLASSPSNSVTPSTVPDAPTSVIATAGNASATISWMAPTNDGGSSITSYTVTSSPAEGTVSISGTTATVTGLTNGTTYTFTVVAINTNGPSSSSSPSNPVTPSAAVPGAPTSVTATAGNASATISWTAPITGSGPPITGYTITSSAGGTVSTSDTTVTVTGLTNGTPYTFTVVATNTNGDSSPSSSNSVTPSTISDPPTSVIATAGNTSATISWTAPTNDGGSSITSYTVTSSPAEGTVSISGTTATVTGLTNGTTYTFTVVATNTNGNSLSSSPSNPVTPSAFLPDPPTSVIATAGNASAFISWTAPTNNGGSSITGYTVTSSPTGVTVSTSGTTTYVNGLTNDILYTFTVVATNANGSSIPSLPSDPIIPSALLPGPPTSVIAIAGNASATISWTPPIDDGGSSITGYTVTSSPGGFTAATIASSTSATVSGLTNGTPYTFTVVATNATGTSLPSSLSNFVTPSASVPDPPTDVEAVADDTSATILWTAPTTGSGPPINSYTVTSSAGGTVSTSNTTVTVTGLTNGTPYTFTVVATNTNGDSLSSSPSNSVTPSTIPDPPTSVIAIAGDTEATISWTAPIDDGGSSITSYTVTSSPDGFTAATIASSTSATVSGLTNGTTYTFTVVATNTNGDSSSSSPSNSVIPSAAVPDSPTSVIATADDTSATISWTAPITGSGPPITGYTITSSAGGTVSTSDTTVTVTGLTNGIPYTFTVVATNTNGDSLPSSSNSVTPSTISDPPTSVIATAGNTSATISWTAPTNDGGSSITSYTVTSSPAEGTVSISGTTATVTGLTNGTTYTFTVVAINTNGPSSSSSPSNPVTPSAAVPGAPTSVTATAGNASATISWTAPTTGYGPPITGYTVTSSPTGGTISISGTTANVTGLTNGTLYTFTVVATNTNGDSSPSSSNSVTPSTIPDPPTNVIATAGNTSATISWTAPTNDGGSSITGYTVTSSPAGGTVSSSGTTATVTGLTNGTTYTFTIVATNANGNSLSSSSSNSVTPSIPPTTQNITQITSLNKSIQITLLGSDIYGTLTYQIVSNPTNGLLSSITNNLVTYTPNRSFTGSDSFTYQCTNNFGSISNISTVFISVISSSGSASVSYPIITTPNTTIQILNVPPTVIQSIQTTSLPTGSSLSSASTYSIQLSTLYLSLNYTDSLGNLITNASPNTSPDYYTIFSTNQPITNLITIKNTNQKIVLISNGTINNTEYISNPVFNGTNYNYTIKQYCLFNITTCNPIKPDYCNSKIQPFYSNCPLKVVTNCNTPVQINLLGSCIYNNQLNYQIISNPTYGCLSSIYNNFVVYTPFRSYTGSDCFAYQSIDNYGNISNISTVYICVIN